MRLDFVLIFTLSCVSICWAQSPVPGPTVSDSLPSAPPVKSPRIEQRAERIHIEDAGSRIDEMRVGGETLRIDVQPMGRMPAYQIQPTTGERSWKILGF